MRSIEGSMKHESEFVVVALMDNWKTAASVHVNGGKKEETGGHKSSYSQ